MPVSAASQFHIPNIAAQYLMMRQNADQQGAGQNHAALELLKLKQKQAEVENKNRIEAYDFALNLLSGVNSEEDLGIAKRILKTKFPEHAQGVDQMLPSYDPQSVRVIRESMRNETQRLKLEESKTKMEGFGAGTMLFKGGEPQGQVPFAPPKADFEVFEDRTGNQVYVREGDPIPSGYRKVTPKGAQANVTVNTGDLTTATTSKLQQEVVEAERNIESFQETRKLFKPEYLTLFGKGDKMVATAADKLGISTEEQKELIRERAAWFRQAKADFIAYRKWATGVAGGEKELQEIATSFPDPVKNSPEEYQANLDNIEETTRRVLELNRDFLKSGMEFGKAAKTEPPNKIGPTIIKFDAQGNRIQ